MRPALLSLLVGATLACGDDGSTAPRTTAVALRNGSALVMTAVSVTPGPGTDAITSSRLEPGEVTGAVPVAALHEYPIVRATVDGREYTLHPVEGFAPGWNPRRPDGRYVVVLTYAPDTRLSMTIQATP